MGTEQIGKIEYSNDYQSKPLDIADSASKVLGEDIRRIQSEAIMDLMNPDYQVSKVSFWIKLKKWWGDRPW